jgi:uncharacterized protein (DUF1697 family)
VTRLAAILTSRGRVRKLGKMATRLAFIRGINVGGNKSVPMAELRATLTDRGFANVRTYIQSGNVFYDQAANADDSPATLRAEGVAMAEAIQDRWGFAPAVMVRTVDDVAAVLARSPYRDADPAKAFLAFTDDGPLPMDDFADFATAGEQWQVEEGVVHLLFPDGLGRSKLAAKLTAAAKTPSTTRNLRTIAKLVEMAQS